MQSSLLNTPHANGRMRIAARCVEYSDPALDESTSTVSGTPRAWSDGATIVTNGCTTHGEQER